MPPLHLELSVISWTSRPFKTGSCSESEVLQDAIQIVLKYCIGCLFDFIESSDKEYPQHHAGRSIIIYHYMTYLQGFIKQFS